MAELAEQPAPPALGRRQIGHPQLDVMHPAGAGSAGGQRDGSADAVRLVRHGVAVLVPVDQEVLPAR